MHLAVWCLIGLTAGLAIGAAAVVGVVADSAGVAAKAMPLARHRARAAIGMRMFMVESSAGGGGMKPVWIHR